MDESQDGKGQQPRAGGRETVVGGGGGVMVHAAAWLRLFFGVLRWRQSVAVEVVATAAWTCCCCWHASKAAKAHARSNTAELKKRERGWVAASGQKRGTTGSRVN
jgi:hypothetical protein